MGLGTERMDQAARTGSAASALVAPMVTGAALPLSVEAEALIRLTEPGCPSCRAAATAEQRYLGALVTELYCHPLLVERIRRSIGFCPAHTRMLMRRPEASFVLRSVYEEATDAALRRLRRGESVVPGHPCLVCEARDGAAERANWFILQGLRDTTVAAAFGETGGFCLAHALQALPGAPGDAAAALVATLLTRLYQRTDREMVGLLAGVDSDWKCRLHLRRELVLLAHHLPLAAPLDERLAGLVRQDGCPVCTEGCLAEARFLEWLAEEIHRRPDLVLVDATRLCPGHLHDLHAQDPEAGAWQARHMADVAYWQLFRLPIRALQDPWHGRLRRLGPAIRERRALWRVLRELLRGRRAAWLEGLRGAGRVFDCVACTSIMTVEAASAEALGLALGDRQFQQACRSRHGVCLRHLSSMWTGPALELMQTRLGLVQWELREARRKSGWTGRHELKGDESSAWLRAPALFDGRIFLGGPPREQISVLLDIPGHA